MIGIGVWLGEVIGIGIWLLEPRYWEVVDWNSGSGQNSPVETGAADLKVLFNFFLPKVNADQTLVSFRTSTYTNFACRSETGMTV